ncbi:Arc family DNA-binding protein [Pantoea ananatis]|uniref:Arc family DNA-binding protein n=1 Tax=Pantoea ananas TaxID=553 RepID=UPI001E63DBFA|nr:Arc family DNA-binding protein [Pantoea ananatis]
MTHVTLLQVTLMNFKINPESTWRRLLLLTRDASQGGTSSMKVKEKMGGGRGRPRKYAQGEVQYRKLWLPENLLTELRVAARVRGYTTNDEIISRLIFSLQFSPRRPLIKTDEGQRLIALARMFDEFIQSRLDIIRQTYAEDEKKNEDKKIFIPGQRRAFSSSFPVNLRRDIDISARFNRRSMNDEIMQRLLGSLNYLTEHQLPENEEVHRLRELAVLFDEFIYEKVGRAENPLSSG